MSGKVVLQIPTIESKKKTLKTLAKQNGYTMSGLVNKLIDDYIKKNGDK